MGQIRPIKRSKLQFHEHDARDGHVLVGRDLPKAEGAIEALGGFEHGIQPDTLIPDSPGLFKDRQDQCPPGRHPSADSPRAALIAAPGVPVRLRVR